jgi:hypothetical protein
MEEKPRNKNMAEEFHLEHLFVWDSIHPSYWKFGMNSDELSRPKHSAPEEQSAVSLFSF